MNPKRWLHEHSLKLLAIRDTPEAIAEMAAPALKAAFMPLDRSGEVFDWDPV